MKLLASILLLAPMVAHAATSEELVGKWVHVKYPSKRVEISENGQVFVLTTLNERTSQKHVAKLVDGMLVVEVGRRTLNADVEKKSGNLVYAGQEYRRLRNGESFEYAQPAMPKW